MDFIPDKEFHIIFNRVSRTIDLKGAGSPAEINERLMERIREIRHHYGTSPLASLQAKRKISPLKSLISGSFGRRTIDEAISDPQGQVALTLKHGNQKAKGILWERSRRLHSKRARI